MIGEKEVQSLRRLASLEFCFRDIYAIDGDRSRLSRWVSMTRAMIGE